MAAVLYLNFVNVQSGHWACIHEAPNAIRGDNVALCNPGRMRSCALSDHTLGCAVLT